MTVDATGCPVHQNKGWAFIGRAVCPIGDVNAIDLYGLVDRFVFHVRDGFLID
jgi:hypothetical protein